MYKVEDLHLLSFLGLGVSYDEGTCIIIESLVAAYLSTVKAVIVKTVAFAEVSAASPRMTQNVSPNKYGYFFQIR